MFAFLLLKNPPTHTDIGRSKGILFQISLKVKWRGVFLNRGINNHQGFNSPNNKICCDNPNWRDTNFQQVKKVSAISTCAVVLLVFWFECGIIYVNI